MATHFCMQAPCPVCAGGVTFHQSTSVGQLWNGGYCKSCGDRETPGHVCTHKWVRVPIDQTVDRTASCPCRPENGGSGICGCVLSGARITC